MQNRRAYSRYAAAYYILYVIYKSIFENEFLKLLSEDGYSRGELRAGTLKKVEKFRIPIKLNISKSKYPIQNCI